ncbi:hypothetical protein BGZ51_002513 [Haplosporangium sp. Z 767]|nr:hypothetical protein BGZ51_002513 [Haplosporangium sp. Z 767]KAF9186446.1 hypothetical protein BGZ50_002437 [Haplosporangium sp. Z 11]
MSATCDVDPNLIEKIKAFRFAKRSQGNAALICKIDKNKLLIEEDADEDSLSMEDLAELLPENTPRYIVLSFELKHDDGRLSFPLVFIYYSPKGVRPELNMLYASAKTHFQEKVDLGKVFDLQDAENLTEEWMRSKLLK